MGTTIVGPSDSFSSVYRINLGTGRADQLGASGISPTDFALVPGTQDALVSASGSSGQPGNLYRVNLSTNQIVQTFSSLTISGIAVEGGGSTALVTIGSTLSRLDLNSGTVTTLVQGLNRPQGIAIEDSGSSVLVGSLNGVSRVNLADGSITPLTSTAARYIAIESGQNSAILEVEGIGLSRLDLTTNSVTTLATGIHVIGKIAIKTGDRQHRTRCYGHRRYCESPHSLVRDSL